MGGAVARIHCLHSSQQKLSTVALLDCNDARQLRSPRGTAHGATWVMDVWVWCGALWMWPSGMSVNTCTKMEHRTLAWVLVINERAWFFSVDLDSRQQGKINHVEERFVPLWMLAISRCKTRKFRRRALFLCFYMFRWNIAVIPGAGWAPRARTNSKKNHITKK